MKQFLFICSVLVAASSFAQKKKAQLSNAFDHNDSVYFANTHYRLLGPFRGGRSGAVAGSVKHKNEFYFGATGGGVWKTIDGGSNWNNISDKYFGGSIGAVALAPSDESILYVGEGENTLRGNVSEGLHGMWRSDDGGRSWRNIGLKDSRHIVRIVIHPKNPDIVWVASMGHLFGPNEERGVYKTTDGGKTWKRTLAAWTAAGHNNLVWLNQRAGCSDLVMEPGNPMVLYAGMWEVKRTPYSMESGGEGSGLYKSTDGGETWKNITANKGLPTKGVWGVVNVAVAPSNTDKVYALVEHEKGGLFVSKDAGETWGLVSGDNEIRQRAWYFNKVFVSPKNENEVYCLNVNMMRSSDGGKTFKSIPTPHGDHHDLWIDPEDATRMVVADDGGAQVSYNTGGNWSSYHNQPTAQFYRVSTDNAFPYHVLGAQQDNSTVRIKSRTYDGGITERDWESTAGFESGYVVADPQNPDIVYGGNYAGYLSRMDHKTGENRTISVWPDMPIGTGAESQKYRFQWNFPIFFSPHNPKKLYAAGNHLFVSENEGQSWEAVSPDLTTNDKSKQGPSGGPITKDNTSVEYYCTIITATESPLERDLLWAGSDDGLIHVSKDGGRNWTNVTPAEAGQHMMWNSVECDPFQKGVAYFVGTRYKLDDYAPYIFKTEDYGKSWKRITAGIDPMHFARVMRADKRRPGLLYAGTEYGMYISYDYGVHWKQFQLNLPVVPITDLTIKNNDLVVATQGRSFYILDDLSVVQGNKDEVMSRNLFVFPVEDAYRMNGFVDSNVHNGGMNPPNGVVVHYYLKDVSDTVSPAITIFDRYHKVVKTIPNAKDKDARVDYKKGMNTFVWDMKHEAGEKIDGMILWSGVPGGPKAAPATYHMRIRYKDDSAEMPFIIKGDPNYKVSDAQSEEQVAFLLKVRDKFNDVQRAIKHIRTVRTQLSDLVARVDTNNAKELKVQADSINKKMTRVEEALYQTKAKAFQDVLNYPVRLNDRVAALYNVAASGNNAPTKQVRDAFVALSAEVDVQLGMLKGIMVEDVKAFNKMVVDRKVDVIGTPNP